MQVFDSLDPRMARFDGPRYTSIRRSYDLAKTAHSQTSINRAKIDADKTLSAIGRVEGNRKFLASKSLRLIEAAEDGLTDNRNTLAQWRNRLLPAVLPENAAICSEIRNALRAIDSPAARLAFVFSHQEDPLMVEAIHGAPDFLTGVKGEDRRRLIDGYVEQHHPNDLTAIKGVEEAIDLANAAVRVARGLAKQVGEFASDVEFDRFSRDHSSKQTSNDDIEAEVEAAIGRVGPALGIGLRIDGSIDMGGN